MTAKKTQSKAKKNWAPKDLTQEQLEVMRKDVVDKIVTARIALLLRHPFFGNMATRLRLEAADDWCYTAATDGRYLYYNTQFFNAMSMQEVVFVIAHEILHCVYDHFSRREDRDPTLYNIAADFIVNNLLVRDKIGAKPKLIDCFQDFKYEKWASEEVYDDLFKNAKKIKLEDLGELLDDHIDWEENEEEGEEGKGGRRYSRAEREAIRDEIKEAMIAAAHAAGAGNVPGDVERLIKKMTEPKMNWRELLRQQIQSTIRNDYTFARPSRKGWHTGAVLPGMNFDETIDIVLGFDMSGSISNEVGAEMLGETQGIMDQYKDYRIKVWCFDTRVYNEQDFTADGGEPLNDYRLKGGGGTDFMANWEYMKKNDIQPKKFIMFTDGYPFGAWGDENYCDTIFVIHGDKTKSITAPFGVTVHYEN